jgi:hypothetical protein
MEDEHAWTMRRPETRGTITNERSTLAKHAAHARWHQLEAKAQRERAEELGRVVKQAIDDYLPRDKRDLMQP